MRVITCQYCGNPAQLVSGATLYPHKPQLAEAQFWRCDPCDAHVGCHKPERQVQPGGKVVGEDATRPLGSLANAPLRSARVRAHDLFDPMWRNGAMTREQAYLWLADLLGVPAGHAHVAQLDWDQCWLVVDTIERQKGAHESPPTETVQPALDFAAGRSDKERRVAKAPDWLAMAGLRFEVKNDGQHIVVFSGQEVIDFWPSTQLWVPRGTDEHREGIHVLIKYCKRM